MDVVRLEGFSSVIKGKKIWIYGDENLVPNRLNVLEQELLGKGKKVLIVVNYPSLPRWSTSNKYEWDAIFRIKDVNDLRLVLTYVLNTVKPVRIVWLGSEPPQQVLSHLKDITVIGFSNNVHILHNVWDAIFFSIYDSKKIEDVLISRLGSLKLSNLNLKSVVNELKVVKAGLVWSLIDESEKSGNVYWYDISEGEPPREEINLGEASSFLKEIANYLVMLNK